MDSLSAKMDSLSEGPQVDQSDNPWVTIGLSLSTSPATLDLNSTEPFYVVVTARVLSTSRPNKPVTLQTLPNPLEDIPTQSFTDMICTTDVDKRIVISPKGPPQYRYGEEDLRGEGLTFVTIPPAGQGVFEARHQIPRWRIDDAHPQKGERYRFRITDRHLGAGWWAFAGLEDLEGIRLTAFVTESMKKINEGYNEEQLEDQRRELKERFGDMPVSEGEDPTMLKLVREVKEAEFEVM